MKETRYENSGLFISKKEHGFNLLNAAETLSSSCSGLAWLLEVGRVSLSQAGLELTL